MTGVWPEPLPGGARPVAVRVAVDIVICTVRGGALHCLLVRRAIPPFQGAWALPGGFVLPGEGLDAAAARELAEEAGVTGTPIEQLGAFGDPGRDPRGPVVSVAYLALVAMERVDPVGGSDATEAAWHPATTPPDLAFDHARILARAVERLRERAAANPAAVAPLLPATFTLTELQHAHEAVLGRALDKRNFRRRLEVLEVVEPTDGLRGGANRPARLYRFHPPAT